MATTRTASSTLSSLSARAALAGVALTSAPRCPPTRPCDRRTAVLSFLQAAR
jgi:hypothetical protein